MVPELNRRQRYGCKRSRFLRSEYSTREPFAQKLQKTRFRVKEDFAEIKGEDIPSFRSRGAQRSLMADLRRFSRGHNLAREILGGNRLCIDGKKRAFREGRKG
jgi:hypothetical protein